jgi:hypothetical protein
MKKNDNFAPLPSFELGLARASLCLLVCVILYALLGVAIFRLWHPDLNTVYRELFATTIIDSGLIRPEPQEKRLFMLVVFTCPFLMLLTWRFFSVGKVARLIADFADAIVAVATALVVAVAIASLAAKNPLPRPQSPSGTGEAAFAVASNVNFGFYFYDTFVYNYFYLYAFLLFPLCFRLLTNPGVQSFLYEQEKRANAVILFLVVGLAAWMIPASTFRFPYTYETKYDLISVYYPVVQVFHGAELLTDGFTDTYGLYPHFLLPLFRLTGLSFATFSATMAVLTVACFSLLFLVLWRFIANRLLLLWTFSSVVFYVYCYARTVSPFDPYFANIPIRLLPPLAALGLSLWYRRGMSRSRSVAALTLFGAGVLWSPDFGLMTYFALTLYLGYLRFDPGQPRRTVLALGETLVVSLVTLLGVFAGYALCMRLAYGLTPDLSLLFGTVKVFSVLGMNLLPMPLLHPWNLMALTLAGGLLATLPQLLRGAQDERSATLFLLTLLGIGTFSYYQGRSHNWNLLLVGLFTIPLWGIGADRLLLHVGRNRWLFLPLSVLVFVLATGLPQLAYASRSLVPLVEERENRAANLAVQQQLERNAEFIRIGTAPGEKVQILTTDYYQGLYHDLTQRGSAFNPGYMNLFWRDDYERFLDFLRTNTTIKIYFENSTQSPFSRDFTKPVLTLLTCCYDDVESNGSMSKLGKRSEGECSSCLEREGFARLLLQLKVWQGGSL